MNSTVQDVIRNEILRLEKGAFIFKVVLFLGGYAAVTWWLNSIRQTAAIWLVWTLIVIQFSLLISFFVSCSVRARQCGMKHRWLFLVAFALSRVNNWEVIVLPLVAAVMLIVSWRNRRVSEERAYLIPPDIDESAQSEGA